MAHYVRPPTGSTSRSSKQVDSANSSRGAVALGRQVAVNMQQADTDRIQRQVSGNAADAQVVVTFPRANEDVFVSHGLGYRVDNFEPISPDRPAKFSMGLKAPNVYGMWIRSDTAGVTVRIRMHGQRR